MGPVSGRGEKRPSEDPLDAARKKVESEFDRLQSLTAQAAECYIGKSNILDATYTGKSNILDATS